MIIYYQPLVKYEEIYNKDWVIHPFLYVHPEITYTIIHLNIWHKGRKYRITSANIIHRCITYIHIDIFAIQAIFHQFTPAFITGFSKIQ